MNTYNFPLCLGHTGLIKTVAFSGILNFYPIVEIKKSGRVDPDIHLATRIDKFSTSIDVYRMMGNYQQSPKNEFQTCSARLVTIDC